MHCGILGERDAVEIASNVVDLIGVNRGRDHGLDIFVDGFGGREDLLEITGTGEPAGGNLRQAGLVHYRNNESLLMKYENHRIA